MGCFFWCYTRNSRELFFGRRRLLAAVILVTVVGIGRLFLESTILGRQRFYPESRFDDQ